MVAIMEMVWGIYEEMWVNLRKDGTMQIHNFGDHKCIWLGDRPNNATSDNNLNWPYIFRIQGILYFSCF